MEMYAVTEDNFDLKKSVNRRKNLSAGGNGRCCMGVEFRSGD